jgi:hypothetical protein
MGEKINWSLVGQEMAVTEKLFTKKKKKKDTSRQSSMSLKNIKAVGADKNDAM